MVQDFLHQQYDGDNDKMIMAMITMINITHSNRNIYLGGLVGGFNPFEKYTRQIGSSTQCRGENKTCLKPPP